MCDGVKIFDRETGAVVEEDRHDAGVVRFIYGTGFLSRLIRSVVRRPFVSWIYGRRYDRPVSEKRVCAFAQKLGIDTSIVEKSLGEYRTLNAFFSRKLKPGARPIEGDPGTLVSPADSCALVLPSVEGGTIAVKGGQYSIRELVGDEKLAARYVDADVAVFRLAPKDYHRFHFPDGGVAREPRTIPGFFDSVSPYALRRYPKVLCRNQRVVVEFETDGFGRIVLIAVGAAIVGRIVMTYEPGRVERGQEEGYFEFGASAVVMIVEKGRVVFDDDLVKYSRSGIETQVKMGERVGRAG
jgi:phosphatidylserine decarboxylase